MKNYRSILLTLVLLFVLLRGAYAQDVTVAVATNLQPLMGELTSAFEKDSSSTVKVIVGSSGKLTTQIENGAPFDVFLSADMKYPEALYKEGLTAGAPKVYAYGVLVLWSMKELDFTQGLDILKDNGIRKIAIANPQLAPYGREAVNAFKQENVYQDISKKLVYGESISQTNDFIASRAADVGITAKSTVLNPALKEKGYWAEMPSGSYNRIAQGAVILKRGEQVHPQSSREFYDFIFSSAAQDIFKQYGYLIE